MDGQNSARKWILDRNQTKIYALTRSEMVAYRFLLESVTYLSEEELQSITDQDIRKDLLRFSNDQSLLEMASFTLFFLDFLHTTSTYKTHREIWMRDYFEFFLTVFEKNSNLKNVESIFSNRMESFGKIARRHGFLSQQFLEASTDFIAYRTFEGRSPESVRVVADPFEFHAIGIVTLSELQQIIMNYIASFAKMVRPLLDETYDTI